MANENNENNEQKSDILSLSFQERATMAKKAFEELQATYGVEIVPQIMPFNNIVDKVDRVQKVEEDNERNESAQ